MSKTKFKDVFPSEISKNKNYLKYYQRFFPQKMEIFFSSSDYLITLQANRLTLHDFVKSKINIPKSFAFFLQMQMNFTFFEEITFQEKKKFHINDDFVMYSELLFQHRNKFHATFFKSKQAEFHFFNSGFLFKFSKVLLRRLIHLTYFH